MRTKSNMFALQLLAFAIAFLAMGLLAGGFACFISVQFIDLIATRESVLLLLFTKSSVVASFLLSVSVSFYVAFYVIRREWKMKTKEQTKTEGGKGDITKAPVKTGME